MIKVLYIAHYFPPLGGAGVQRSVKFIKYLPEHGFLPVVLTGAPQSRGRWAPPDESLLADIPDNVKIYRVAKPDSSLSASASAWERFIDSGVQAGRENNVRICIVSMSPFGDSLAAAEIARRLAIPWVADLRDPWALDEFQVFPTRWHRAWLKRQMGRRLASAAKVIMNTPAAATAFRRAFPHCAAQKVTHITNGYDQADFETIVEPSSNKFSIVHSGALHPEVGLRQRRRWIEYRLLGRLQPGVELLPRSQFFLLKALEKWLQESPGIAEHVELRLVGAKTETDYRLARDSSARDLIRMDDYLPHTESVRVIQSASLLFLPMHKLPTGQRATIVPGKTYEYMATGRPILAAVPEGDARDFVLTAGTGSVCEPDDVGGMLRILKEQFTHWSNRTGNSSCNKANVERFERRVLTKRLGQILQAVLGAFQHS